MSCIYISIGTGCNVKYQIDKHIGVRETLFFDRLMTDMRSVINILSCPNIDSILDFNNISRDSKNPFHGANSRIVIKSMSHCVSIHDLAKEYSDRDMYDFIDKYKRRFSRIIQYIKRSQVTSTSTSTKIYFIRYGDVTREEAQLFIKTVMDINPECNFDLVVVHNSPKNIPTVIRDKNYLKILTNVTPPESANWTASYLNWEQIFRDIANNTD